MEEWPESQARANAEEGTPREDPDGLEDVPLSHLVTKQRVEKAVVASRVEGGVVPPGALVVVATLVSAVPRSRARGIVPLPGQLLITSFFTQCR